MTDTTEELVARLNHAMATMANDDLSAPRTDKRKRFVERMAALRDCVDALEALTAELAEARAEVERLRELIFGAGVNLWDQAEMSERDDAGNQTILLWHPSGMPVATLRVDQHNPNLGAAHIDLLMSDLLDVFVARQRARAALNGDDT